MLSNVSEDIVVSFDTAIRSEDAEDVKDAGDWFSRSLLLSRSMWALDVCDSFRLVVQNNYHGLWLGGLSFCHGCRAGSKNGFWMSVKCIFWPGNPQAHALNPGADACFHSRGRMCTCMHAHSHTQAHAH